MLFRDAALAAEKDGPGNFSHSVCKSGYFIAIASMAEIHFFASHMQIAHKEEFRRLSSGMSVMFAGFGPEPASSSLRSQASGFSAPLYLTAYIDLIDTRQVFKVIPRANAGISFPA